MATEDARKLFVAGLPESITEDVLRQLFEAAGGTVVDVSLPRDRATGRLRGFGFVTLSSPEEAEAVRGSLDGSMQSGRSISVRPFKSEPKRGESRDGPSTQPPSGGDRTVYVGNLPYDVSQQEVEQLFAENEAGPVVRVHLPSGPDGRPRGFGFVTLADAEAANGAVAALREAAVRGRRLVVNIAHPRGAGGAGGSSGGTGTPRPPREQSVEREPRPRYPSEPDVGTMGGMLESARPVEGRRARAVEGKRKKTKTVKKKSERGTSKRGRGGGGSWQKWEDWDDD